jgi:hypothetical protein
VQRKVLKTSCRDAQVDDKCNHLTAISQGGQQLLELLPLPLEAGILEQGDGSSNMDIE